MILQRIVEDTKIRVKNLENIKPLSEAKKQAQGIEIENPFFFESVLKTNDIAFICEVKKASPSKGVIAEDFPYIKIAQEYQMGGANAISVLTEPNFFMGSDKYLSEIKNNVSIPLLRKDFTVSEYQIYEAKIIGADAILLICSILDTKTLSEYIKIADSLGLSCVVEAHDENEITSAIEAGARIIGVNNRNLKTFDVDIANSIRLRSLVPKNILFVSESGIKTAEDVATLRNNGANAVLIGETLMKSDNKSAEITRLKGEEYD